MDWLAPEKLRTLLCRLNAHKVKSMPSQVKSLDLLLKDWTRLALISLRILLVFSTPLFSITSLIIERPIKLMKAPGTPCPVQSAMAKYVVSYFSLTQKKSPLTKSLDSRNAKDLGKNCFRSSSEGNTND